jgi:hypothetical protein
MAKKNKYKAPEVDDELMKEISKHNKIIDENSKIVLEKYRKWWDKETHTWKKGFEGHGK